MASYRPFSSENPICRKISFRTEDRAFSLRRRIFSIRSYRKLRRFLYNFSKDCFRKLLLSRRRQNSKQDIPLPRRRAPRSSEERPPLPRFPHFSPLPLIYVKENVSLLLQSKKLLRLKPKLSRLLLSAPLLLPCKVLKTRRKVCSTLSPFNKTSRREVGLHRFLFILNRKLRYRSLSRANSRFRRRNTHTRIDWRLR